VPLCYMVFIVVQFSDLTELLKLYIVQQYQYAEVTPGYGVELRVKLVKRSLRLSDSQLFEHLQCHEQYR
jgi:hypothetical protein